MISQGDKKNGHIKKSDAAAAVQKQQAKQPPAQSLESSSSSGFGCPSSSVRLSGLFMLLILLISVSVSFTLGRYCQSYHFPSFQQHALKEKSIAALLFVAPPPKKSQFLSRDNNSYTKNIKQYDDDDDTEENDKERDHNNVSSGAEHLLIDVTHVDPAFLSSPTRLETSLLTLLHENLNDQMLSFRHTNRLEVGGGISFTVLLLQSHVFLHAWPSIGVLTLDIYKSKSLTASAEDNNRQEEVEEESIINLVPVIENLFAMGDRDKLDDDNDKQPHFFWSIKDRAVDYESDKSDHPADSADYRTHYLGRRAFTHKQQVSVVETPFQTFEVYDVIDIRDAHQKADRILFLDHVTQSSRRGLEPYHEALVHPALLAHPNPKRVAIVGGGEGATLREVLIHSTVETVVMIEIDAVMVNASKTALLEWNDCSDLVGSTASCFDDPRAEVYLEDAVGWFLDRYYKRNVPEEEKFDVIIMDALDPSSLVGFSDVLYGNLALAQSMRNALTDQGILISQVGAADVLYDAGSEFNAEVRATKKMLQLFREVGFVYSLQYNELHCGFLAPWAFLISFLDATETKTRWYSNPAAIDLELSKRAIATISGDFPCKYFDGATMATYQYPSRADQNVHCRSYPSSTGCPTAAYRAEHHVPRLPLTGTALQINGTCSSMDLKESVQGLSIMPTTAKIVSALSDTVAHCTWGNIVDSAIESFGFGHYLFGSIGFMVNPSFTAHHHHGLLSSNSTPSAANGTRMSTQKRSIVDTGAPTFPLLTLDMDDALHQMLGNAFIARNLYSILSAGFNIAHLPAAATCVYDDDL